MKIFFFFNCQQNVFIDETKKFNMIDSANVACLLCNSKNSCFVCARETEIPCVSEQEDKPERRISQAGRRRRSDAIEPLCGVCAGVLVGRKFSWSVIYARHSSTDSSSWTAGEVLLRIWVSRICDRLCPVFPCKHIIFPKNHGVAYTWVFVHVCVHVRRARSITDWIFT